MLSRFGKSDDPMIADFTAWTAAVAPDAVQDFDPEIALAERAAEAAPDSQQFARTLGAILYRAGRHRSGRPADDGT